jgi:hypothetical protein
MAGSGSKRVGHIGRDHHKISFPSSYHLLTGEELQFPIQDVEEFGRLAMHMRPCSLDPFPPWSIASH